MILSNFVVFEGLDGTGTTTQLLQLKERAKAENNPVFFTGEPTNGEIGKLVRKILSGALPAVPETLARLFAADRGEHLYGQNGILSHLKAGEAVFCDRYVLSSLAYQGLSADPSLVQELNHPFPLPEYLFFFEINPEKSMERVERRGEEKEIFEKIDFQKKVSDRYVKLLERYQETEPDMTIIRIDAAQPIPIITEKIWSIVGNLPKL
ncbi:MAG TPA: dTMP kinase [Treponema sp.]|nr:dTMP kinase [Treponema sp.]